MATSFMLQPSITMNSLTNQYSIIQISPIKRLAKSPNFPRLITNPKMTLKCSVWGENLNKPILEPVKKETKENPYEVFANAVLKSLKTLQEATLALVLFMGVAFMSLSKNSALAAGGGRMGGSDFSSSSSSSSSWSSPSSSSSSSWSSPSSSSSSWSSPSSSSSYDYDDDYSTPSFSLSSLFRSSKLGGDVALVESVSVETAKPPLIGQPFWSPTKVIAATLGVLCVLTAIMNMLSAPAETTTFSQILKTSIGKSVLTLQVGVLGSAKSLQKELDRIAKTANTSTKAGLTYVLTETTSAVLHHIDYCISAYSSVDVESDTKDVETLFNRSTLEERAKLDEETLVNVNNKKKQSTSSKETPGFKNEYIVITIIVAAERVLKLPKISSSEDLKEALKIIGSITTNKTLGVEVLWTPQDENETLTEREVLEKYPLLRSLSITL